MSLEDYTVGQLLGDWLIHARISQTWQDWSSGWSFEVKVAPKGSSIASFTKSSGITGGVGTDPNAAVPVASATVAWTTGDLGLLTSPGPYVAQFKAVRSSDSKPFIVREPFNVLAAIT